MLEVHLLGSFEITYRKEIVAILSRPAQSLFAYLILSAGTSHRREKLAGLLWPELVGRDGQGQSPPCFVADPQSVTLQSDN